jgi:hypothetical protein
MSLSSTPLRTGAKTPHAPTPVTDADTQSVFMNTWTPKIDALLHILRENCNYMSKYHNFKYQFYKERLKWFRIPIIVLSAINAFTAVGLQPYTAQRNISTINSIISLLCGILTSVELFLNIQKKMENDLMSHKDYYTMSMDIFKMVSLDLHKRNVNGRDFLDDKITDFKKLIQSSNIIDVDFYIDIYDDDDDQEYDIETGATDAKTDGAVTPLSKKHKSNRFTNGLEKICTPNNHRINKYRKDMKSHVQKYSKTIRPQFMVPGASETVYSNVQRTLSAEDMTNGYSGGSGKYISAHGSAHGSEFVYDRPPIPPYTTTNTGGGRRYSSPPPPSESVVPKPLPYNVYDLPPKYNHPSSSHPAKTRFNTDIEDITPPTKTPAFITEYPYIQETRFVQTIKPTIVEEEVHEKPSPKVTEGDLIDMSPSTPQVQFIRHETMEDIMSHTEHKDAGVEESSISSAGAGMSDSL